MNKHWNVWKRSNQSNRRWCIRCLIIYRSII